MKLVFAVVVSPLFLLSISVVSAETETCRTRAQKCVDRWGAPHAACYDAFRLAACEKTGKYVAPNGNVWPITRTKGS